MKVDIDSQCEAMDQMWPEFQLLAKSSQFARWEGPLRPLAQRYRVRISLGVREVAERRFLVPHPEVVVVKPLLRRRAQSPGEPVPHHYRNRFDPYQPILCLYDPDAEEWCANDSVAEKIVPWTIDWLACYEGWLATGQWTGGGRHPEYSGTERC